VRGASAPAPADGVLDNRQVGVDQKKQKGNKMAVTREQMREIQASLDRRCEALGAIIESVCDGLSQCGVRASFSKSDYGKGRWNANLTVEFSEKEEA